MTSLKNSSILDATAHNHADPGSHKRSMPSVPNGAFDQFNFLPPGEHIEDTGGPTVDVKNIQNLEISAPLTSSSQRYTKGGV